MFLSIVFLLREISMNLHGLNLRALERTARKCGCFIKRLRRTGEGRMYHKRIGWSPKYNARRKDAPRELTAWVQRVLALA